MTILTRVSRLFFLLCYSLSVTAALVPADSRIEVRLVDGVSTRTSRAGDPVRAVVISPIVDQDTILLRAGSVVRGRVEHVDRFGLGLRRTSATLDLRFTTLQLADGTVLPIDARLASVEEARETVSESGRVTGIHPSASFSTGVSSIFSLLLFGEPEFRLAVLTFKLLAARSPDAEVNFPAGTEMLVRLTRGLRISEPADSGQVAPLLPHLEADVQRLLGQLPQQQTMTDQEHPSDLINIVLSGTAESLQRAFRAAGWTGTEAHGVMALYHMYDCVTQRVGYSLAPMSSLKFNGEPADAAFQKSLNTFAKRHHVRFWRDERSGLWLGAATEDVKYARQRMHLSHAIDPSVDNERAKIVNDLVFTGCVDAGELVPRRDSRYMEDGSRIVTDGGVAVLRLNACEHPNSTPNEQNVYPAGRLKRTAVAIVKDIARSNPITVGRAVAAAFFNSSTSSVSQYPIIFSRAVAISTMPVTPPAAVIAGR